MSDEAAEKILAILNKMSADIDTLKNEIRDLSNSRRNTDNQPEQKMSELEIFNRMSNLLDDDEAEAFGRFMDGEEVRKAAI